MESFWTWVTTLIDRLLFWQVIQPDEGGIRTTFGLNPTVINSGIHWVLPIFGEITVIPVKEQVLDIRSQSLTTADDVPVAVGISIAYEVLDVKRAILEVQDWDSSLSNESLRVVGEVIRTRTYAECTVKTIAEEVKKNLRSIVTRNWGISILRVGVSDFARCRSIRIMGIGGD